MTCMRHVGSFGGADGFPYIGSKGNVAGKFSIAIDRRIGPSKKPLNPNGYNFRPITLFELFVYAKDRENYPHLRIRCKPDKVGTKENGGRFLREMMIDWNALDRCLENLAK